MARTISPDFCAFANRGEQLIGRSIGSRILLARPVVEHTQSLVAGRSRAIKNSDPWSSQGFPESCLTIFGGGFEVIRTDATDVAVPPPWIVE
jgi:hypothetical protein